MRKPLDTYRSAFIYKLLGMNEKKNRNESQEKIDSGAKITNK